MAVAAFVVAQLLTGCASRPATSAEATSVDASTAAAINVYRPAEGMVGKALNYYVYVDGTRFGRVNSEESASITVAPGKHELSVQSELLGVVTGTPTRLALDIEARSRFSVSVGDIRVIGTAVSATTGRSLLRVDRETWNARR